MFVLMLKHVALKLHNNIKLDATDCLRHFTVRSFIRLHVTPVHAIPFPSRRKVYTVQINCIKKLKSVYLLILGNRRKEERTCDPREASLLFLKECLTPEHSSNHAARNFSQPHIWCVLHLL
jgi:hypothetical protein